MRQVSRHALCVTGCKVSIPEAKEWLDETHEICIVRHLAHLCCHRCIYGERLVGNDCGFLIVEMIVV